LAPGIGGPLQPGRGPLVQCVPIGHQPRLSKQNPARYGGDYRWDLASRWSTWSWPDHSRRKTMVNNLKW